MVATLITLQIWVCDWTQIRMEQWAGNMIHIQNVDNGNTSKFGGCL